MCGLRRNLRRQVSRLKVGMVRLPNNSNQCDSFVHLNLIKSFDNGMDLSLSRFKGSACPMKREERQEVPSGGHDVE